jgi:drug/metabolite transporter (DMT)-like permease
MASAARPAPPSAAPPPANESSRPVKAERPRPSRARIYAAFAAVYIIWGSTYLGIKFAIRTLPPFLMAGARFLVAGAILYAWARRRDPRASAAPTAAEWGWAFVVGGLLLFGGNGAVVWASHTVPSGVISLLVASTPIWMVLLEWAGPRGVRPTRRVVAGLLLGFGGMALLITARGGAIGGVHVPLAGALVLLAGSLSWAVGSLASRSQRLPTSLILSTAMQMLAGGVLMAAAGLARGELAGFSLAQVSTESWVAWTYLFTFGSLIGFTAYIWLLDNVSAASAATYAYVNPVVAVFLGWALAGESVTGRVLLAAATIIGAVALITGRKKKAA